MSNCHTFLVLIGIMTVVVVMVLGAAFCFACEMAARDAEDCDG